MDFKQTGHEVFAGVILIFGLLLRGTEDNPSFSEMYFFFVTQILIFTAEIVRPVITMK